MRTCVRIISEGSPYSRFRRALASGNLVLVRAAAAELPQVPLDDALQVCLLLRGAEPQSYERAVLRWLGRFALERARTVREIKQRWRPSTAFRRAGGRSPRAPVADPRLTARGIDG